MRKACSPCFDSQSDRPETSTEMTFQFVIVDATCQEEAVFEVVNLNAVKWLATASFKDLPSVQMATDALQDTALQSMINDSIELARRLVTS